MQPYIFKGNNSTSRRPFVSGWWVGREGGGSARVSASILLLFNFRFLVRQGKKHRFRVISSSVRPNALRELFHSTVRVAESSTCAVCPRFFFARARIGNVSVPRFDR